jgi:hypothetical protein
MTFWAKFCSFYDKSFQNVANRTDSFSLASVIIKSANFTPCDFTAMIYLNTTLTDKLAELTNRLFWYSESDFFPFQIIMWDTDAVTPQQLLKLTYHPAGTPIELTQIDEFFAPIFQPDFNHFLSDPLLLQRYRDLLNFLKYNLSNIQVYYVGKNHIYVYILGVTRDDNLAGIATQMIES